MNMKKSKKRESKQENTQFWLSLIKYIFLAVLFIAPLFKGLFFEDEFLPIAIILALITLGFLWVKRRELSYTVVDVLFLLLCLSYLASFFVAAHPRAAYLGFLKYIFYFACFILASKLFTDEKTKKHLLLVSVASVTISTLITLLTHTKIITFEGAIWAGRFSGTFQYPNTYAAVLIAVITFIMVLYVESTKQYERNSLLAIWFFNTVAFYATLSRGALIFYVPILTFLLFFLPKTKRLSVLNNLLLINGLGLAIANLVLKTGGVKSLLLAIGGAVLVLAINYGACKLNINALRASLVIYGVLAVCGIVALFTLKDIPALKQFSRLVDINLQTKSASERITFYIDALKILKNSWQIGVGAGGWQALYRTVQGHLYHSTEVHSSIFQSLVEVGIIGTSLFLMIFVITVVLFLKKYFRKEYTLYDVAFILAVLALFGHSLIDFDLSVTAVTMFFFTFAGVLLYDLANIKFNKALTASSVLLICILFFSSLSLGAGHLMTNEAISSMKDGKLNWPKIEQYESNFLKALKFDPLNSAYAGYAGQLKIARGTKSKLEEQIEQGLKLLDKSIELEPYNYETHLTKAKALVQLNHRSEANHHYNKIIELMPLQHTGYEFIVQNYLQLAMETGNKDYLHKILGVYQEAANRMKSVETSRLRLWHGEHLDQSPVLNYNVGIAQYLLGDYTNGLEHFNKALKFAQQPLRSEITAWVAVGQKKLNYSNITKADERKITEIKAKLNKFGVQ